MRGLSFDETSEFERIDASRPFAGKVVWLDGLSQPSLEEVRWLELWAKHRRSAPSGLPSRDGPGPGIAARD
jgi:hypothetical protein